MIRIHPLGGYSEMGRNMVAIEYNDEFVIMDCGLMMEKVVSYEGNENATSLPVEQLYDYKIVADDREFFRKHGKKVKAFVISHAHLDHSGAVPKVAPKYNVPIIGTSFTIEVIKKLFKDVKIKPSRLITLDTGRIYKISENLKIELINVTHSTPQTAIIALHTPEGTLLYANDWKFDDHPTMGDPTNYERLKELGKKGVKVLISDTTRVEEEGITFSESLVNQMFKDVFSTVRNDNQLIVVTTFSSHIARIKMLTQLAKEMNRKVFILGRSMSDYMKAAMSAGVVNFTRNVEILGSKNAINKAIRDIKRNRGKYMVICTGNQGEPESVLTRIVEGEIKLDIKKEDTVVFSSTAIPTPVNMAQRANIEKKIKNKHVRLFVDVHVSGHGGKEDHRNMLKMIKPEHFIPTHGDMQKLATSIELATELGYDFGTNSHILRNGQVLEVE